MTKLNDSISHAGMNAGAKVIARMMRVSELKTDPALSKVFEIKEETLTAIILSMKKDGYDKAEPLVIWKGKNIVVDGHTRLEAAKRAGIVEIPVEEKEFSSLEDAVRYCKKRQKDRRNLSPGEILAAVSGLQKKVTYDGNGRGAESLAKELGVSSSTINHAKAILTTAPKEVVEKVRQNKLSINKAYTLTKQQKNQAEAVPGEKNRDSERNHPENILIVEKNEHARQTFTELYALLTEHRRKERITCNLFHDIIKALAPFTGKDFYIGIAIHSPENNMASLGEGDYLETKT